MLITTKGIALHSIAYNDRNDITYLYTRDCGLISLLVPRSRSSRGKHNRILSSPPLEVELVCNIKHKSNMAGLSQFTLIQPYSNVRFDPIKGSVMMFLCEFLYRILREPQPDKNLYDFISGSFDFLDNSSDSTANFHVCFLYYLLMHLGFSPDFYCEYVDEPLYFDMTESCYSRIKPSGPHISPRESKFLPLFQRMNYSNMHLFRFTRVERQAILKYLITYYRLHLPNFGELKTLEIMKELFS